MLQFGPFFIFAGPLGGGPSPVLEPPMPEFQSNVKCYFKVNLFDSFRSQGQIYKGAENSEKIDKLNKVKKKESQSTHCPTPIQPKGLA